MDDGSPTRSGSGKISWHIETRGADHDGNVRIRLRRSDDAWVDIAVHPVSADHGGLVQTDAGDLSYVACQGVDEIEAARVTRGFGRQLVHAPKGLVARFPHVAHQRLLPGKVSTAVTPAREVLFDPPGLASLLAPELVVDGDAMGPYMLRSIQLPMRSDGGGGGHCLLLEFAHEAGGSAYAEVGRAVTRRFADAGPVEVGVRQFGRVRAGDNVVPPDAASLYSRLVVLLRQRLAGVTLRFPRSLSDMRALSVPAEAIPEVPVEPTSDATVMRRPVLNLAVDAPCNQQCAFCSVQEYVTPGDRGDQELVELQTELARARARGVREFRLNGIDPLAFSKVIELVGFAADNGFDAMTVFTTGRRFADRAFLRRFLGAAPAATTIVVPVYGPSAAVHDAVVGTPGAFDQVCAAVDALSEAVSAPAKWRLSTVLVQDNVDHFAAIAAFARARDVELSVLLPYPMRQTVRDPYAESAVRESDLVRRAVESDNDSAVRRHIANVIPHPCVLIRAEQQGLGTLYAYRDSQGPRRLHGTEYRDDGFVHVGSDREAEDTAFAVATVPCPKVAECALAPDCVREQYAVYVQLHGWDEMQPVSPKQLYELGRA